MSNSRLKISVGFRVSNSEAIDGERVLFFQWYWLDVVGGKMYMYIYIYTYYIYRQTDNCILLFLVDLKPNSK